MFSNCLRLKTVTRGGRCLKWSSRDLTLKSDFFSHSLVASTMHSSNDTGKYLGKFYRLSVLVVLALKFRKAFMENHRAPMEVFCDKPITCK